MPILPARRQETPQTIAPQRFTFPGFPDPYWSAQGAALYLGDVRACLRRLPAQSVHCCVTSPPYWGLRDYGTANWVGGNNPQCNHTPDQSSPTSTLEGGKSTQGAAKFFRGTCGKCGAKRVDMQIGAEPSPDCGTGGQAQCGGCFVCSIVGVMREVQRVLRDDGTCWLNLGDTFDNGQQMIPARVAIALSGDGWKLVQDIIWYSPNKMPESVTNRCTKSHEHIFLLAKSQDYYYDAVAIQEPAKSKYRSSDFIPNSDKDQSAVAAVPATAASRNGRSDEVVQQDVNKRDVWVVPTQGYPGAHFAVYSPRLITPCILAGTSEHGCCAQCGRPWERVVAKVGAVVGDDVAHPRRLQVVDELRDRSFEWSRNGKPGTNSTLDGTPATRKTLGWRKMCGCQTDTVVPAVVLDPFVGSGTTVATAIQLGRAGVGIDLSETYLRENAISRIEAALMGDKVKRVTVPMRQGAVPVVRKLRGVE